MARVGPVSSLDAASRLFCLAAISSASLFAGPFDSCLLLMALLFLLLREGLKPLAIAKDSSIVLAFTAVSGALRMVGASGPAPWVLGDVLSYGLRLLSAFLAGRLFYASTRPSELRDAATRITRRLPFVRRYDLGLGLYMVLGLVPLVFEEWRSSLEAARSRGMPRRPSLALQAQFIAAFLRRMMLRAVAIPEALVARAWSPDRGLPPSAWRTRDTIASLSCLAIAVLASLRLV